jgi:hypothetical protein
MPEGVMTKSFSRTNGERVLGWLGLLLLGLVGKLAGPAYAEQRTRVQRVSGFLARRAIDAVAVVGWLADRLPGRDGRASAEHLVPSGALK